MPSVVKRLSLEPIVLAPGPRHRTAQHQRRRRGDRRRLPPAADVYPADVSGWYLPREWFVPVASSRTVFLADASGRYWVTAGGLSARFWNLKLNLAADALSCFNVDQRSTPSTSAIAVAGFSISCVGYSCRFDNSASPRLGEILSGRDMILKDKLQMLMARYGLNGQSSPGSRR